MIGANVLTYDCNDVPYLSATLRKAAPAGRISYIITTNRTTSDEELE
jgi:hypothetical protein